MFPKKFSPKKGDAKHSGSLKQRQAVAKNHRSTDKKKGDKKYFAQVDKKQRRFDDDYIDKPKRSQKDSERLAWKKDKTPKKQSNYFVQKQHNEVDDFADKAYHTHKKNHLSGSMKKSFNEELI